MNRTIIAILLVLAFASTPILSQTNTLQVRDGANTATLKAGASGGNVTITLPTSSSTLLSGSGTTNKSARWSASGLTDGTFSDNGTGTFTTSESVLFTTTDASSPSIGFSATGVQPGTTTTCSFSIKNNSMSGYGYVTGATLAVPNNATAGLEFVINGTHKGMLMLETWALDGTYARNIGNVPAGEYQFIVPNTTSPLVAFYIGKVRSAFEVGDLQVLSGNILVGGSSTASQLRFYEPSGSGTNYTAFKAGIQTSDITYTLPQSDGSSGQVLSTNGSGTLTWTTATSVAAINDLTDAVKNIANFSNSMVLGTEVSTMTDALNNTAVGMAAMDAITSGDDNTVLGYNAATVLSDGSQNVVVGSGAGALLASGSGNVMIGYQAGANETGSNKLYIDNSSSATPLVQGDFNANTLTFNGATTTTGTTTYPAKTDKSVTATLSDGSNAPDIATFTGTFERVAVTAVGTGPGYVQLPAGTDGQVVYLRLAFTAASGQTVTVVNSNNQNTTIVYDGTGPDVIIVHMLYTTDEGWVRFSTLEYDI